MSLRRALEALPDDRESLTATREVVAFLDEHSEETLTVTRIARATGVDAGRLRRLLAVFVDTLVVDFLGDSPEPSYRLSSSPVLSLEVRRFVRAQGGGGAHLQKNTEKFRSRFGTDR